MQSKKQILIFLTVCMLLFLAACNAESTPSTETLAETEPTEVIIKEAVEATATAVPATNTPSPTEPPAPTDTPIPPTEEPTLTIEATDTPEAEATPLPDGWYDLSNFPDDMNPLTGEIVDDPAVLDRRPIALKISNYPPLVRPQHGLNRADLVFEHLAEGGATRFTAVYYSQDAHTVGSIRSARILDFEIPVMYDSALGYSGSAGGNKDRFALVDWFDRIVSPDFGHGGYYRDYPEQVEGEEEVDFWHTMFTNTERIRAILQERGLDVAPQLQNSMVFSEEPAAGGTPAKEIEIRYSGNDAFWWYDSGDGRYYRWTDGERHLDANYDEQVNFKNIVVVSAPHVESWIMETEVGQGAHSIEIQIWGEGPASIFRDGQRFDGHWERWDPQDMLTFYDEDGNPIPLAPGNTWFQMVPLGFEKLIVD